jgi:hypothetical protein
VSSDGFRVERDGAPSGDAIPVVRAAAPPLPAGARGAASLATALAGLALPMMAAQLRRRTLALSTLAIAVTAAVTILCFQAAATAKVGAFVASVPPFVLLVAAAASYGSWRWPTARSRK